MFLRVGKCPTNRNVLRRWVQLVDGFLWWMLLGGSVGRSYNIGTFPDYCPMGKERKSMHQQSSFESCRGISLTLACATIALEILLRVWKLEAYTYTSPRDESCGVEGPKIAMGTRCFASRLMGERVRY